MCGDGGERGCVVMGVEMGVEGGCVEMGLEGVVWCWGWEGPEVVSLG